MKTTTEPNPNLKNDRDRATVRRAMSLLGSIVTEKRRAANAAKAVNAARAKHAKWQAAALEQVRLDPRKGDTVELPMGRKRRVVVVGVAGGLVEYRRGKSRTLVALNIWPVFCVGARVVRRAKR